MSIPPIVRAGLQSGSIMTVADVLTQLGVERCPELDHRRTLRWTLGGLCLHGPYFFKAFQILDKTLGPATSLKVVAQKTAIAQFMLFPPYLVALFTYLGLAEGNPDVAQKVRHKVPEAFIAGCVFWPVANGVNFMFVSGSLRIPWLAASAGCWNMYLSWENHRESAASQPKEP